MRGRQEVDRGGRNKNKTVAREKAGMTRKGEGSGYERKKGGRS
jgi:hypothetical protein